MKEETVDATQALYKCEKMINEGSKQDIAPKQFPTR